MKKIVGVIQPFLFQKQKIYVYENNEIIGLTETSIKDFAQTIVQASKKYNVKEVWLKGPKSYMDSFAKEIKEEEIKRYSENQITIEILEKGEKIKND